MSIEPQQASRVRCRPIAESDLAALADLLTRGFPRSRRDYWTAGFARWKNLPVIEGVPRYGYLLEGDFGPVGVILLISSKRGEQIISNLSSWYVEPQWRAHSTLLISLATKLKHVTYLNASPAPQRSSAGETTRWFARRPCTSTSWGRRRSRSHPTWTSRRSEGSPGRRSPCGCSRR